MALLKFSVPCLFSLHTTCKGYMKGYIYTGMGTETSQGTLGGTGTWGNVKEEVGHRGMLRDNWDRRNARIALGRGNVRGHWDRGIL